MTRAIFFVNKQEKWSSDMIFSSSAPAKTITRLGRVARAVAV